MNPTVDHNLAETDFLSKTSCTRGLSKINLCFFLKSNNCLIVEEFNKVKANCDCPYACESEEYSSTLSYSPYPSDIDARTLSIKEFKAEGKNATEEEIQNRIVEIRFGDY